MTNRVIDAVRQAQEDYHRLKGGAGSGNFGHSGRPGKIGGSAGGGGGMSGGVNPEYTASQDVITSLGLNRRNPRTGRYSTTKNLADIVDAADAAGYNLVSSKAEPVVEGSKMKVTRTRLGFGDDTTRGMNVTTYDSGKSDIWFGSFSK